MMVQGCWQASASVPVHGKHDKRPDALAKEPGAQQLQAAWPTAGLKDPEAQRLHFDAPRTEWEPAGHPLIASTIFEKLKTLPVAAKHINNRLQQHKQTLISTHATHLRRRRILQVPHSAAMWLQDNIERRREQQWSISHS
jgi:hypothetical protein